VTQCSRNMTIIRPDILVRPAVAEDAPAMASIYNHYVAATVITFDESEITAAEMARRLDDVAPLPWLVAEREGRLLGYAYATKWRARPAYRFSAEVTVYVDPGCPRAGVGSRLYQELLPQVRACGIHTVMGGIALPNDASVAFHESFGFSKVAHFREVGFKFERWIDVGYWQLDLSKPI
jgi:L-amino acid N-acyltransferase YncA